MVNWVCLFIRRGILSEKSRFLTLVKRALCSYVISKILEGFIVNKSDGWYPDLKRASANFEYVESEYGFSFLSQALSEHSNYVAKSFSERDLILFILIWSICYCKWSHWFYQPSF